MRIKAKTSPTGYVASVTTYMGFEQEHPVIRFDDAGHAMISDERGLLVRVATVQGFNSVYPMGAR